MAHIEVENLVVRYGSDVALDGITLSVPEKSILGVVGPANSGKTTFLRCLNRTIDFTPSAKVQDALQLPQDSPIVKSFAFMN